ncbi:hypothetical protein VZT92_023419 [Zoarces viviparus]|uniref:BTB domain-containing protein n=1 Tax=Zoarces viviparus TaxID=48416 RepID=A0AAW1E6F7_ZOAVI
MWCYQKPGFEALLLAELQRQQQCGQFCDTLLKTDGVSVPAHSCILSAISPHISSALSSSPPPPAGQNHLLEFRALGACTLLHMVRLLYSGEMAGEGEEEKREAISAAAKLGIHGLVEVTKRDGEDRNEEVSWRTEVGVQTKPEENEGRPGRWRRGVTDGRPFPWRETASDGKKDTWTQTEQLQVHSGPPPHPAASFETIDMTALQGLGQTDAHLAPPQIPYIPISFVYPLDENQIHQSVSPLTVSMQGSTAAGHTFAPPPLLPSSSSVTTGPVRDVTAVEEWRDERVEQFQGNIPEYISYFLNPDKGEGFSRGRAMRRRGAGVGGARRAGTGERRARRPRARTGGRGGLTQTVDVQEVGVSRLQKLFRQRWGPSRAGQGGGAVGRKLHLKTRELLRSTKSSQRRRGRGKVWEFSPSGDALPYSQGGGANTQQSNQDGLPVGRARRAKPTAPVSFPSPHKRFHNVKTSSALSPSLQPSPSPAASYVPPASPLLLSTSLPPPAPPPHEEQPEHFDRLLEEVMMGLDIRPNNNNNNNNNNSPPHSQPPLPTGSGSNASRGDMLVQNKHRDRTSGLLEASPAFHGSTQVVARGDVSSHRGPPALQQQCEGELNEMLGRFLQSFEQHVDSCPAREEVETGGQSRSEASQPYTGLIKYRKSKPNGRSRITELYQRDEAEQTPRGSHPCKTPALRAAPPKNTEEAPVTVKAPAKQRKRRRKNDYLLSLEKKRVRGRKPSSDAKRDKQLQQRPVVELERIDQLPARVTLQKHSCVEVQSPAKAKSSSSSVNHPRDSLSTKQYPIWSRLTDAHVRDGLPVGRARRAKPTAPVSFPSPHKRFHNVKTSSALSPSLQPSPSPAASYVPPASPLLLSTSLPPPAPPPHEEQPEHFDRLLEEVMMGLDIRPNNNNNNNNSPPHSQPPLPTGSGSNASRGDMLVQNKHRDRTSGLLEASPAFHGSTQVVARGDVSSHRGPPALQQQCEGELNEMLGRFLQSFEQHVDSCPAREEVETGGQSRSEASQPYTGLSKYRKSKPNGRSRITELHQRDEAEQTPRGSQPCKTPALRAAPPKNTEEAPVTVKAPAKQRKRRRKNDYLLSLEKKRVRGRKPSSDAKRDKQLQQRPVVELERIDQLPARVTLQKHSCVEVQSPAKAKSSSSSVNHPRDSLSTKQYPIRSRLTDAHVRDSSPFLEEPLRIKRRPAEGRPNYSRDEPNKEVQLLSLSNAESSTPPIQLQPVEPRGPDEQLEKHQGRHEEEAEGATKRGAESEEVTSDESTAVKRIFFTLTSARDCLILEDRGKKTMWSELSRAEEMEVTEVDGDPEGDRCQSSRASTLSDFVTSVSPSSLSAKDFHLRSTGSWEEVKDEDVDVIGGSSPAPEPVVISWTESSEGEEEDKHEDVDVIGGSSPAPEPVVISWTESSEGEEEDGREDIDVVGEKTDYALSAVSKGELVNLHQHL